MGKRDDANSADGCRGVAVVYGLTQKCTDNLGVVLL